MATNAEEVESPLVTRVEVRVPPTLLLKPEDAAKYLGVGRQWMYRKLAEGEIVSIREARKILVPVKALNEWIERRMEEGRNGA